MILLLEAPLNTTDPLALIIAAGAAIISGLASVVLLLLFARLKRMDEDVKSVADNLTGRDGMAVKIAKLEGDMATAKAEIHALKHGTLSREIFERATKDQNEKLDDLKQQTRELDYKVEKIDRTLPRPYQTPSPYPPGPPRK